MNLNLLINQPGMFILPIFFMLFTVEAQSQDAGSTNLQRSLAVVIPILSIMFSLTFLLLIYVRFCHRVASVHNNNNHVNQGGLVRSRSRFSGIDRTLIQSLPFFRFSSLKGSREGLECAVCLSKFEDTEILRLLPKCKHAFHIGCVDQWLEDHSSCPLCRQKVSADDLNVSAYSNSFRFLCNNSQSERREDLNLELFVEREPDHQASSRFSFRKIKEKGNKEEELPIQESSDTDDQNRRFLHKFNHRIVVSDVVLRNRWSNVSSSDLMFLNSEMLGAMSSNRFTSSIEPNKEQSATKRAADEDGDQIMKIKEEIERKREFEIKVSKMNQTDSFPLQKNSGSQENQSQISRVLAPNEQRSMSEIIVHPRLTESTTVKQSSTVKEERRRRIWLPIARRTVQWFANRERRSQQNKRQSLNV